MEYFYDDATSFWNTIWKKIPCDLKQTFFENARKKAKSLMIGKKKRDEKNNNSTVKNVETINDLLKTILWHSLLINIKIYNIVYMNFYDINVAIEWYLCIQNIITIIWNKTKMNFTLTIEFELIKWKIKEKWNCMIF